MLFLQPDVVALVAILQGASPSSRFVWLLIVMAAEITESARFNREREREGGRKRQTISESHSITIRTHITAKAIHPDPPLPGNLPFHSFITFFATSPKALPPVSI